MQKLLVAILTLVLASSLLFAQAQASSISDPSINWNEVSTETTKILQDLIRINTTNPPGNELVAARYLQELLGREGIPSEILEAAPGRGSLIARLTGD